jgi:NAD(P)-dependent dehydrogenase (short-subunit alcohol dehydrogenase family)
MLMASEGAKLVINDIGVDDGLARAEKVAEEIKAAGGEAMADTTDVATFDGSRRVIEAALENFGDLDIVVNNAGLRAANPIQEITEAEYQTVLHSHLTATFGIIKHAAPIFIERRSGIILNTSSESGFGHPYNTAYSAAKEGITGLTRSVARELGPYGVRCNQIRPRAEGTQPAEFIAVLAQFRSDTDALGRFRLGTHGDLYSRSLPDHVAPLAVWLCTDAATAINGFDFFVMGDEVGLWSEPDLVRQNVLPGGWSLDLLDEYGPTHLIQGLQNHFLGRSH